MSNLVIIIFVIAGIYTFYMGFVDGASAVASCIATHALKPRQALLISSLSMFIFPIIVCVLFKNDGVARTVGSLIHTEFYSKITSMQGFIFLLSTMIASCTWAVICIKIVFPNSASHTLLGGLVGAGIVCFGFNAIDWTSVLLKVVLMIFLSPLFGIILGFILQKLVVHYFSGVSRKAKKALKITQGFNVIFMSASVSINNIQKSMGIFLLSMVLCMNNDFDSFEFKWYIVIFFAVVQALGLIFGGEKLINSIGRKIYRLSTVESNVAQISAIAITLVSTFMNLPIATGQVVSSAIIGVGVSDKVASVRWLQAKKIFLGWLATFPIAMLIGAGVYYLLNLIIL